MGTRKKKNALTPDATPSKEVARYSVDVLPAEPDDHEKEITHYINDLHKDPEWLLRQQEFSPEELIYYERVYAQLMIDFGDDVKKAERFQIFQAIDCQIYLHQYKKKKRELEGKIEEITVQIDEERRKGTEADGILLARLEDQRQVYIDINNNGYKEFTAMNKKFEEILVMLKSTREQRIKNLEGDSNKNWISTIKKLQEKKSREKAGREIELRKLSMKKAEEKLKSPHKYANGEWDQPILTAEDIRINYDSELSQV